MKRLLMLVAAMGFVASANAQDAEIKNSGEFRLRYQNIMNPSGIDDTGDNAAGFMHRFKWNINARKGENLQAMVSLIHNAQWGYSDNDSGNDAAQSYTTAAADTDNFILVNRVWGWWKTNDMLSFKFGRMGIEIADGAVFSENDWEEVPTAHDAIMGMWDASFAKVAVFGIKNKDTVALSGLANPSSDPETNIYGASLDFKNMPEAIKIANFHVLQRNSDEVATAVNAANARAAESRQHFGLTVGGDIINILYKGTVAYQTGKLKDRTTTPGTTTEADISAMMYDLMVGYQLPEVMGLKITAGYHSDSGEEASADKTEAYDPMYYDVHNYAGLMDVLGWGNLTYWNVNVSLMPMETLEAGIGYYMFSKTEDTGAINTLQARGTNGRYFGATAPGTDDQLGSELDVYVNKAYDNGFKIGARYSMFMTGDAFDGGTPSAGENPSEVFVQASLNF